MKHVMLSKDARLGCLLVGAGLALLPAPAPAFQLVQSAFSGGAVSASEGSYRLRGTLGEAGVVGGTSGGSYMITQGFWANAYRLIVTDAPAVPATALHFVNGLESNFPNPFTGNTSIVYTVAQPSPVRLVLFDVTGRRIRTLVNEPQAEGSRVARWDGRDSRGNRSATGVYFYRLEVGEWSDTRKMLKLR